MFHALADANRRAIVSLLARGECSIGELVPSFPVSFVAVSKHLKVLEAAGLVRRRRQGATRCAGSIATGNFYAGLWYAVAILTSFGIGAIFLPETRGRPLETVA